MKKRILVEPVWQTIWQWPAVINLICGGTASGYYFLNLMVQRSDSSGAGLVSIAAPLLVLLGFGAVGVEAARPSAARYLMHHLHTSWMSREVLAGSFFILFSTLDAILPHPAVKLLAALSAGALLVSQTLMVYRSRAVVAWNHYLGLCHFLVSGFYLGFGLLLLLQGMGNQILTPSIFGIGLLASGANLGIWHRIVLTADSGDPLQQAIEPLRDSKRLTFTGGMTHIVSMLIILILLLTAVIGVDYVLLRGVCVLTGIVILIGGGSQKYAIILRANLLRELSAEHCTTRMTT